MSASWLTEEPVTWGEVARFWMQVGVMAATLAAIYGPRWLPSRDTTPTIAPSSTPAPVAPVDDGVIFVATRESRP